ncbi:isoprenylcysteine carboxylmethyltransferase family protein [Nibrella saemangeumensis]|uniref:Isoprenylcysteine carboxylmethyltransferase family protein n=1 Tax=Nibrella saemangeumensis TaxID=1084526 RepID=A0ABP8NRE5_9BACT
MNPYLSILLAWVLFGSLHSLTASNTVKDWFRKYIRNYYRYYRLLYNGLAVITFVLVLAVHRTAPADYLWALNLWSRVVGAVLLVVGFGVAVLAFRQYDLGDFTGLDAFRPEHEVSPQPLVQAGLLQYVRHPLYTGSILLVLGLFLLSPTLSYGMLFVLTTLYIRIGIYFEEQKLLREFGSTYRHYQQRVPMLWPTLWAKTVSKVR